MGVGEEFQKPLEAACAMVEDGLKNRLEGGKFRCRDGGTVRETEDALDFSDVVTMYGE